MYNSETLLHAQLPSSRQLLRSTLLAAISAIVLLTTVVLPAEYGIDPTGIGRVLGLTDMGVIKTRLAAEAEADAAASQAVETVPTTPPATAAPAPVAATSAAVAPWRDEQRFVLTPGQGIEVKLRMKEGEKARFAWTVEGGAVNYDTHGDGGGRSISYEKGRGVPADEGELVAAFTGNHGWFWRNRGQSDVTVTLRTGGEYAELLRAR